MFWETTAQFQKIRGIGEKSHTPTLREESVGFFGARNRERAISYRVYEQIALARLSYKVTIKLSFLKNFLNSTETNENR